MKPSEAMICAVMQAIIAIASKSLEKGVQGGLNLGHRGAGVKP